MTGRIRLSIVFPAFNEEANITEVEASTHHAPKNASPLKRA
jgi:hypothetical protein